MPRVTLRLLRYIVVCVLGLSLWLYCVKTKWIHAPKTPLSQDGLLSLFALLHGRHPSLASLLIRLRVYDGIYSQTNVYDFLRKYSLEERCILYFDRLSMSDPEWLVDPSEKLNLDRTAFHDFERYKKDCLSKWTESVKKAEKEGIIPPERPNDDQMRKDLELLHKTMLSYEQQLHDFVSHVRVFDKCYMGSTDHWNDTNYVKKQQKFLNSNVNYEYSDSERKLVGEAYKQHIECDEVERKIFPFLTTEYPLYTRWNGETSYFPGADSRMLPLNRCFLNEFKQRINGKGIVMTLGDSHIDFASRLLRLLRYFHNPYPIQVVFHENLLKESREYLIRIAREEFHDYPPQDLWFVDVSRSVTEQCISKFSRYGNKLLAVMFNSFEDMFLLDADSVILKDIDYFFSLKHYVQSGAFFYKDRSIFRFRLEADTFFFKKLLPSVDDSMVFNIPQTTNYTFNREFFSFNLANYMESGVVILNRKKHFMQPFMMAILNFYNLVTSRVSWGDKELFWLACVYLGNENYYFNENFAATIGDVTPESERRNGVKEIKTFRSKEICSGHPSHISDEDDSLVWFNSGFRNCVKAMNKDMDFQQDFDRGTRFSKYKTLEEFRTFYKSQSKIPHAIIPPFKPSRAVNVDHEPEVPWVLLPYCQTYIWCAYSLIGGSCKDSNGEVKSNYCEGRVIDFSELDQKHFEAVGNVWMEVLPNR